MSSDNVACSGTIIEYKNLKKICPNEIKAIEDFLENNEDTVYWIDIGSCGDEGDFDFEGSNKLVGLIRDLQQKFTEKTKVGDSHLTLSFSFFDEEGASDYDDRNISHNGCIFLVDGHVKRTEAGEKFKKVLHETSWSQWG